MKIWRRKKVIPMEECARHYLNDGREKKIFWFDKANNATDNPNSKPMKFVIENSAQHVWLCVCGGALCVSFFVSFFVCCMLSVECWHKPVKYWNKLMARTTYVLFLSFLINIYMIVEVPTLAFDCFFYLLTSRTFNDQRLLYWMVVECSAFAPLSRWTIY